MNNEEQERSDLYNTLKETRRACGLSDPVKNALPELAIFPSAGKKVKWKLFTDPLGKMIYDDPVYSTTSIPKMKAYLDAIALGCKSGKFDFDKKCARNDGNVFGNEGSKTCNFIKDDGTVSSIVRRVDLVHDVTHDKKRRYYAWILDSHRSTSGMMRAIETDRRTFEQWIKENDVRVGLYDPEEGETYIDRGLVHGIPMTVETSSGRENAIISFISSAGFHPTKIATGNERARNVLKQLKPVVKRLKEDKMVTEDFLKSLDTTIQILKTREPFRASSREWIDMKKFRDKHLDFLPDPRVANALVNNEKSREFMKTPIETIKRDHGLNEEEAKKAIDKARETMEKTEDILIEQGIFRSVQRD